MDAEGNADVDAGEQGKEAVTRRQLIFFPKKWLQSQPMRRLYFFEELNQIKIKLSEELKLFKGGCSYSEEMLL